MRWIRDYLKRRRQEKAALLLLKKLNVNLD